MSQAEAIDPAPSEQHIWVGHPSQLSHLGLYIVCLVFAWLVIPVFIALWTWIATRAVKYELTTQRIRFSTGVFTREVDDIELYRVKDYRIEKPFWLRLVGLGHIIVLTSDQTTPELKIRAIAKPEALADLIREHVERRRDAKRVSEIDME
ncbi:PH domain-containing protein [Maricaulis sp. CAU 1757]